MFYIACIDHALRSDRPFPGRQGFQQVDKDIQLLCRSMRVRSQERGRQHPYRKPHEQVHEGDTDRELSACPACTPLYGWPIIAKSTGLRYPLRDSLRPSSFIDRRQRRQHHHHRHNPAGRREAFASTPYAPTQCKLQSVASCIAAEKSSQKT